MDEQENQIEIGDYTDVEITETEYLFFPWFIRGKLNAIQGDTSTGKSTFLYTIGAYVSKGWSICDSIPCENPGNVMFLTLEDSESDVKTAFQDAGGDVSKLKRIKKREAIAELKLDNDDWIKFIEKTISDYKLRFLVFDPIQAFLGGEINKANETRPQLEKLAAIAEKTGCCIAFIQHMGKDDGRKGLYRGIGSADIVAATRSLIQIVVDPEDERFIIAYTIKNNTASKKDTEQAIRYQIKDHPGAYDQEHGKYRHFHGHAELTDVMPKYNERMYRAKLAKSDADKHSINDQAEYEFDPLVKIIRSLAKQNPNGMFIGQNDLIRKITEVYGRCQYPTGKGKGTIAERLRNIRTMLMNNDKIQIDQSENPLQLKPYMWNETVFTDFDRSRDRGITITCLK